MNKKQQEQLLSFLEQITQAQISQENIKKVLIKTPGYDVSAISESLQTPVTPHAFARYLDGRVACNQEQLHEIFIKFDWNRKGTISEQDLERQLTPFNSSSSNCKTSNRILTSQIQGAFLALILQIVNNYRILQVARKQVGHIPPYQMFSQLDLSKSGYITLDCLKTFYTTNQVDVQQNRLTYLLKALKRRYYNDINLQVFCQSLFPLQFGQYQSFAANQKRHQQNLNQQRYILQQNLLKRSRQQALQLQQHVAKVQRRKVAEVQRQVDLQRRINQQLIQHQQNITRSVQKAQLQDFQRMRNLLLSDDQYIRRQQLNRLNALYQLENSRKRGAQIMREPYQDNKILQQQAIKANNMKYLDKNNDRYYPRQYNQSQFTAPYQNRLTNLNQQISRGIQKRKQTLLQSQSYLHGTPYRRIQNNHTYNNTMSPHFQQSRLRYQRVANLQKQLADTKFQMMQRKTQFQLQQRLKQSQFRSQQLKRNYYY